MLKRIITPLQPETAIDDRDWLDLEHLAEVELSSEDPDHPIENALTPGLAASWRAAKPGKQTIRLILATPQRLQCIQLHFMETRFERTQEYSLRWSADGGQTFQDIARQQWNFSPSGSTSETENHRVEIADVNVLELNIIPDIKGGDAVASLELIRLG